LTNAVTATTDAPTLATPYHCQPHSKQPRGPQEEETEADNRRDHTTTPERAREPDARPSAHPTSRSGATWSPRADTGRRTRGPTRRRREAHRARRRHAGGLCGESRDRLSLCSRTGGASAALWHEPEGGRCRHVPNL
jgi:hypothetical protein